MPPTRGADGGKRVLWRTYNKASDQKKTLCSTCVWENLGARRARRTLAGRMMPAGDSSLAGAAPPAQQAAQAAAAGAAAAPQAVRRRGEERPPLQCVVAVALRRRMGEEGGFAARSAPQQPHSTRRLQTNAFSYACLLAFFAAPRVGAQRRRAAPGGACRGLSGTNDSAAPAGRGGGGACAPACRHTHPVGRLRLSGGRVLFRRHCESPGLFLRLSPRKFGRA